MNNKENIRAQYLKIISENQEFIPSKGEWEILDKKIKAEGLRVSKWKRLIISRKTGIVVFATIMLCVLMKLTLQEKKQLSDPFYKISDQLVVDDKKYNSLAELQKETTQITEHRLESNSARSAQENKEAITVNMSYKKESGIQRIIKNEQSQTLSPQEENTLMMNVDNSLSKKTNTKEFQRSPKSDRMTLIPASLTYSSSEINLIGLDPPFVNREEVKVSKLSIGFIYSFINTSLMGPLSKPDGLEISSDLEYSIGCSFMYKLHNKITLETGIYYRDTKALFYEQGDLSKSSDSIVHISYTGEDFSVPIGLSYSLDFKKLQPFISGGFIVRKPLDFGRNYYLKGHSADAPSLDIKTLPLSNYLVDAYLGLGSTFDLDNRWFCSVDAQNAFGLNETIPMWSELVQIKPFKTNTLSFSIGLHYRL